MGEKSEEKGWKLSAKCQCERVKYKYGIVKCCYLCRCQEEGGEGSVTPCQERSDPPMRYSARSLSAETRHEMLLSVVERAAAVPVARCEGVKRVRRVLRGSVVCDTGYWESIMLNSV